MSPPAFLPSRCRAARVYSIVSAGYSTEGWGELFVCAGGAAAVLSGLIFVAVSVNLDRVLELDRLDGRNFLTGRALEALVALLNVLVVSVVALTPTIPRGVLAAFIIVVGAESAISPLRAERAARGQPRDTPSVVRLAT